MSQRAIAVLILVALLLIGGWMLARPDGETPSLDTDDTTSSTGSPATLTGTAQAPREVPTAAAPEQAEPVRSPAAIASSGTVLLRVVDAEDGHAVGGARVWPWPDCTTDESGQVRLPPLEEPSGIEIRIECRGYVPAVRRLYAQDAKSIALRRGVPLEGRVLSASTRAPIPEATILVRDGQEAGLWQFERTTGPDGRFEVPGVVAGRMLEILVEIAGRAPTRTHAVMEEPTTQVEVLVAAGCLLEGRVERPDHSPAAGVDVFLVPPGRPVPPRDPGPNEVHADRAWHIAGAPHVRTTDDGTFTLGGIPTGEDFVAVAVLDELWEARSAPFRFTRPGERRRLSLTAPEPASVSIRLASGVAKSVLLYAVSVRGPTMWARQKWGPALAGPCLVTPLSPGAYQMTAHLQGSPDLHRDVSVGPGDRLEWILAPEAEGGVSGVVVDSEGKPQAEVMLFWRGERSLEGSTDSDGNFRLEGVGAEEGELIALKWGPDSGECRVKGVAPGTQGLRLVLSPPAKVIVDVEGLPPDTQVTAGILTENGRNVVRCRLDGEGRLTCSRPSAGAALLVLMAEGHAPVLIDLPPSTRGVPARLGPVRFDDGIVMEGRVLDPAGNPVAGADVWIAASWSRARAKTDAEGAFRFAGLPRRSLLLGIQAPVGAPELQRVKPGVGVTLRLSTVGLVEGTVVSQGGVPVAGMSVRLTPALDVSPADDASSGTRTAATDALGHFTFAAAEGLWSASIDSQGEFVADPVDVRLTSAEPSIIRLVLRRR